MMILTKMVKGVVSACTVGALLVSFSACGSGTDADGKTTISFLSWSNEQVMKPFIDQFEKEHPDVKVDFSYAPPTAEYIQTLQTRLVGNQAPDVFIITSENKDGLISNDYAKDLTDEPFMADISDANKEFVEREGKIYGMSTSSWASGIVYNRDLLRQVGVDEPPATWDEFLALCHKLKDAGVTPFLEALIDGMSRFPDSFQGAIFAKEGTDLTALTTQEPQTPGATEKDAVKAWLRLYEEELMTRDAVGINGDDVKTQFANGQVAMICTGPWDFSTFQETDGLDWGYAQMPAYAAGYERYSQGSPSPALTIHSKLEGDKLKAAESFLDFMRSDWALEQQSRNGDAVTVGTFASDVVQQYETVYEQNVKTGKYYLMYNFYRHPDVLQSTTQAETQQLVQGTIDVDQWAANVDSKLAAAQ